MRDRPRLGNELTSSWSSPLRLCLRHRPLSIPPAVSRLQTHVQHVLKEWADRGRVSNARPPIGGRISGDKTEERLFAIPTGRNPMTRTSSASQAFVSSVLVLAVVAVVAGSASSAQATPPGRPGPIAFQRFIDPQDEDSTQIFTVAADRSKLHQLTSGGTAVNADYSADGERIVFERRFGGQERGRRPSPRAPTAVPDPTSDRLQRDAQLSGPQRPQVVSRREPARVRARVWADRERHRRGARHSHLKRQREQRAGDPPLPLLEAQGQEPHDAQWSPDGTRIAVHILNTKAKPRNGSAIYVLDADGSGLHRVTPSAQRRKPGLFPQRKRIVFNSSYEAQAAVEISPHDPA